MDADELFQAALECRKLAYTWNDEGLYVVQLSDVTATISLGNIRRNYERDGDAEAVERFVQRLDTDVFAHCPPWDDAARHVRYSLEPSDYATGFDDTLHEAVTEDLARVFVLTPPDGSRISWITHDMVAKWGVRAEDVVALTHANMERLVGAATLDAQEIDGVTLGMLALENAPFKASLILSSQFRRLVSSVHGWPVLVVAPARDFVYVLATVDRQFLNRLRGIVLREYQESGHPITADVLEVGDHGIMPIGSFAARDN
ncbi:MAG: hypothetical protein AAF961_12010 [Planctomycetota bacterium]